MNAPFDVIVMGEVLVELSTSEPFGSAAQLQLGFSGDALNVAAAAAAAGASTALLARIADDDLGQRILRRLGELSIDSSLVTLVPGQQGVYFVHADPLGHREFVYSRRGSAGSTLDPQDVIAAGVESAAVVVSSGITCAISDTASAAVHEAAQRARSFIYDPNFRGRLTDAGSAADHLRRLAPYASLVTPACPGETGPLLGTPDPRDAAIRVRELGADAVAVTRGADGIILDEGCGPQDVPAVPAASIVDQTGAGDSLVGTIAGRLALGDTLLDAVRLGAAASSLSLQGQGGTGFVASLAQSREHLRTFGAPSGEHHR